MPIGGLQLYILPEEIRPPYEIVIAASIVGAYNTIYAGTGIIYPDGRLLIFQGNYQGAAWSITIYGEYPII